jgi:hypothetical protein
MEILEVYAGEAEESSACVVYRQDAAQGLGGGGLPAR